MSENALLPKNAIECRFSNFGPIVRGKIILKDLTIIHGPNGSGKSYSASIMYNIINAIRQSFALTKPSNSEIILVEKNLKKLPYEKQTEISDVLHSQITNILFKNPNDLFLEAFGCPPSKLINTDHDDFKISINIGENQIVFNVDRINDPNNVHFNIIRTAKPKYFFVRKKAQVKKKTSVFDFIATNPVCEDGLISFDDDTSFIRMTEILNEIYINFYRDFLDLPAVYYLPAARTGIMQFHEPVIEYSLRALKPTSIAESQTMQINRDFLYFFYSSPPKKKEKLSARLNEILENFESKVLNGKLTRVENPLNNRFEYKLQFDMLELDLMQSSSLITEIVPILVYLRFHLNKNDILFIEEPEAHLNLNNQWILAQLLVRCVREGFKIVIITHSHYLITRFNNFVLASQLTSGEKKKMNYEKDYLDPKEVIINEFKKTESKNQYEIINLEATIDGLDFSSFNDVIQDLSNEYHMIMDILDKKKK